MAVVHGQKMVFKREGHVGRGICKNCGHDAYMTLCRHLNQGTLFWIPVYFEMLEKPLPTEDIARLRHLF